MEPSGMEETTDRLRFGDVSADADSIPEFSSLSDKDKVESTQRACCMMSYHKASQNINRQWSG